MNDLSEIESELKKLRPKQPSRELFLRIERAIVEAERENKPIDNVVRPERFRLNWVSVGLGLAAAAALLIVARIEIDRRWAGTTPLQAHVTPVPVAPSLSQSTQLIPSQLTQVVYNTRDEGLHFPAGSDQPMRRLRSQKHETLQWRNPATGASLRVSYPSEEVELVPVVGQ
jgi:hypothetical protein